MHAVNDWHVALSQVPARAREAVRAGGPLVVETMAGPRFTGDAEADKQITRQPYRKPYVV